MIEIHTRRMQPRSTHLHSTHLWCLTAFATVAISIGCADRKPASRTEAVPKQPQVTDTRPKERTRPSGLLPKFREVGPAIGIDFKRYDDMQGKHRIMESNGGGVGLIDYDRDGQLDVFYTDGCRMPLRESTPERSSRLYRQSSHDQFKDITSIAGLHSTNYCYGCAVGDIDSDGFDDLYVTGFGMNHLWHNNGDGTFSDITTTANTQSDVWSSSAAFADINRDGHLDLYVTNYVKSSVNDPELCPDTQSPDGFVTCSPTVFRAEDDDLFVADGSGAFMNITQAAGVTGLDGKGLGVVICDVNQDGWPDIYVANDGMPNFLYINQGGDVSGALAQESGQARVPQFIDEANFYGAAVNQQGTAEASMGVAHGDIDADGWIDLLVTHFYTETNTLYRNLAGEGFLDETPASGLGAASRLQLGFGTEFFDFDNDGSLDLFVANGHVDDLQWQPTHPPYGMTPQFFRNDGYGRFEDVSEWSGDYFRKPWIGRGVATGDIDSDGDIDLMISHQRTRSAVLRNDTASSQSSVLLRLVGTGSNRSAINARIEATLDDRRVVREIVGGGSYQSASDQRLHIGLGDAELIDELKIHWPSGGSDHHKHIAPGSYLIREGTQTPWTMNKIKLNLE